MAVAHLGKILFFYVVLSSISEAKDEEDLMDFDFTTGNHAGEEREMMIAQESRQYKTVVKAPIRIVKPNGITNSHRPQYNLDSYEDDYVEKKYKANEADDLIDFFEEPTTKRSVEKDYKLNFKAFRPKEAMIRDAVQRALERKDYVGKFAQILPIIRAMSGSQRIALAALVASQVTTPPGQSPLNLAQVRSMFGNNQNATTTLMLPILLDMANLIRRSVRSNKETREVREPPKAQLLRRSFTEDEDDTFLDGEPFEKGYVEEIITSTSTKAPTRQTNTQKQRLRNRNTRNKPQKVTNINDTNIDTTETKTVILENTTAENNNISRENANEAYEAIVDNMKSSANFTSTSTTTASAIKLRAFNMSKILSDNSTMDLTADSTNHSLSQDIPVAEKLRALNRYVDRKGNLIRQRLGQRPPIKASPQPPVTRRTTAESSLTPVRRRPIPARKLPTFDQAKCELFTNSLCLHSEDYPTDAILLSIRRNKAAAGALLADFRDPGDGALDGVTAAQEAKYTAEHYLTSNRRGDTANRDFASAGEAGFMCPSTVKYARPQRARATSGQWKYIVNTGEHTQTLRLEKCLKPKESCTYLTDNFKSKCVQVYNYHRLLTWDQQNGLHMDIFKVPTCCSCHIEGYSVSFPPLGHRVHETSSEQFPGEDLSANHGNNAFESVQSTIQRPSITKKTPFSLSKPVESFHSFGDNHNLISGAGFSNSKLSETEDFNVANAADTAPMDSYGNSYFPDSFNQASNVRNIKRPSAGRTPTASGNLDSVTLPSYLEPPTPSAGSSFKFGNDKPSKFKPTGSQFKRGTRPSRRPMRKKVSAATDDLMSSGTSAIESLSNIDTADEYIEDQEEVQESIPNRPVTVAAKPQPPKIKLVEKTPTTYKPNEQGRPKRVNYNYHPIIDFFENDRDDAEAGDSSIDRDDSLTSFVPESEWKPINHPVTRDTSSNQIARKKHK